MNVPISDVADCRRHLYQIGVPPFPTDSSVRRNEHARIHRVPTPVVLPDQIIEKINKDKVSYQRYMCRPFENSMVTHQTLYLTDGSRGLCGPVQNGMNAIHQEISSFALVVKRDGADRSSGVVSRFSSSAVVSK